ncbi:MAG: C10 family peptidase [Muribaculaceae bacterium]|nr:C10 family peptidase [Muribaculaceae bacterium]
MRKFGIFFLLIISVGMSLEIHAEQVSESKAQSVAAKFMKERGMGAVAASQPLRAPRSKAGASQQEAAYYVFNAAKDRGFVIVSGDDRTEQVLGYSDKGNFDPANVPENMKAWLNQYVEEISMLDEGVIQLDAVASNAHLNAYPSGVVQPFMRSEWDQGAPFYSQCPKYSGTYCQTGCVATAMAQVMYYYKWPSSTSKAIPGYTQTANSMSGTTYEDLPVTTFDWSVMKDYYSDSNMWLDDPDKAAVAKLMHYCGQAVQMKYGVSSSSASGYSEVFSEYFRYSTKARRLCRYDYSWSQWQDFIVTELKAKRPVLYMGSDQRNGHAFVFDGYDGSGYYHINWGWRGRDNGYFLLSSLDPIGSAVISSLGYNGYVLENQMIIGLEPNTVSTNEKNSVVTCSTLDVAKKTYTRSSSSEPFNNICLYGLFRNESFVTKSYKISWAVYKSDGFNEYQYYNHTATYTLAYNEITDTLTRFLNFGKNFENGTYYLRPICLEEGGNAWHPCHDSGNFFIKAVINGNTLTLTPIIHYFGTIGDNTATIVSYSDIRKVKRPIQVKVKATRSNLVSDYIQIYLFDNDERVAATTVNFGGNSLQYVDIKFIPKTAGTHNIKLASNSGGSLVYCTGTVDVEDGSPANLTMDYAPINANSNKITYDNFLTYRGQITNNHSSTYYDYIVAELRKDKPRSYLCGEKAVSLNLAPGETTMGYFTFNKLEPGEYHVSFYYYNENILVRAQGPNVVYVAVRGDVNGDYVVTAADVTALYDHLLNGDNTHGDRYDVNGDGDITAADVTAVYDILLGN